MTYTSPRRSLRHLSNVTATTPNKHSIVKYVLSAEFDNKIGSVIKHQIPKKIPGYKENELSTLLPELMIPLNSEQKNEDYNCFILYLDKSGKYNTFPDIDKETIERGAMGLDHLKLNEINTIYEPNEEGLDDILFFYNVVKKIDDETDERGAIIKSICIGTPLRNFVIFKHIITMTIQSYIQDPKLSQLISLFNDLNKIDITSYKNYMNENTELFNLFSLNLYDNNKIISSILKTSKNGYLNFKSNDLIPLKFSLFKSMETIQTDLNVYKSILKFLLRLSIDLNSILYKNLNIVIFSNKSNDFLSQFLLSLSNFLNGFNNNFYHNDKILYFPNLDLYNWENFLKFNEKHHNFKLIGTNNSLIKQFEDSYDFFYDLDEDELIKSSNLETFEMNIFKTFDFTELLQELIIGEHDSSTIELSLQRFNINEIIKILNRNDVNEEDDELDLKDYYLKRNKNLILFDEFFEFKMIRLIDGLHKFITTAKTTTASNSDNCNNYYELYDFFTEYASSHLNSLLFILEIFPFNISTSKDLIYDVGLSHQAILLNELFKPILFKDLKLQIKVFKLYKIMGPTQINQRLNDFLIITLNEFMKLTKTKTQQRTIL